MVRKRKTAMFFLLAITIVVCLWLGGCESDRSRNISEYDKYVGASAREKSSTESPDRLHGNEESLYAVFPGSLPASAVAEDFVYYYYNPWDPCVLVYLVYTCSENDFNAERERLKSVDSTVQYSEFYGVTGFPYTLESVIANDYGFTYCLSDEDDLRLIYVQNFYGNYFTDIDYEKYIDAQYLPIGYDANPGNPVREEFNKIRAEFDKTHTYSQNSGNSDDEYHDSEMTPTRNGGTLWIVSFYLYIFLVAYAKWYIAPIVVLVVGCVLSGSTSERTKLLGRRLRKISVLVFIAVTIAIIIHFLVTAVFVPNI